MINIVDDLHALTDIPKEILQKFIDIEEMSICYSVQEQLKQQSNFIKVDIGIGVLNILLENNQIKYKFIPSEKLNNYIINTCTDVNSPLVHEIEQSVVDRLLKTYKGLI